MKVLLHGATNGSNFGDFIFAAFFYRELQERGIDARFYENRKYGISEYFKRNLNYTKTWSLKEIEETDALVYISGGYFCELPGPHSFISEIKDINRYLYIAKQFMKRNKPIYVLGVGAGPFTDEKFSKIAIEVLNYAKVITVRDEESKHYCESAGVTNNIVVTTDTALLIKDYLDDYMKPSLNTEEKREKRIVFHIDSDKEVTQLIEAKLFPAVKKFLINHPDYKLYLSADGVKKSHHYEKYKSIFKEFDPVVYVYDDPWLLCKRLEKADVVITTKLHVGIVASALGASVLSFPNVPIKTMRYYKQIGESGRCNPLREVSSTEVEHMLEKYFNIPITIPQDIINKARINLDSLPDGVEKKII